MRTRLTKQIRSEYEAHEAETQCVRGSRSGYEVNTRFTKQIRSVNEAHVAEFGQVLESEAALDAAARHAAEMEHIADPRHESKRLTKQLHRT